MERHIFEPSIVQRAIDRHMGCQELLRLLLPDTLIRWICGRLRIQTSKVIGTRNTDDLKDLVENGPWHSN